jgi:hypothetical protein
MQVDFRPRYADFLREVIIKGVDNKDHPRKPLVGVMGCGFFAAFCKGLAEMENSGNYWWVNNSELAFCTAPLQM